MKPKESLWELSRSCLYIVPLVDCAEDQISDLNIEWESCRGDEMCLLSKSQRQTMALIEKE